MTDTDIRPGTRVRLPCHRIGIVLASDRPEIKVFVPKSDDEFRGVVICLPKGNVEEMP